MGTQISGTIGPFAQSLSSIGPMLNIIGLFSIIASIDYRFLFYIVLIAFALSALNIYMPYKASGMIRSNGGYYAITGTISGKTTGITTAYLYLIYGFSTLPSITLFLMSFSSFFIDNFYLTMTIPVLYTALAIYVISRGVGRSVDVMKIFGLAEIAFIIAVDIIMLAHRTGSIVPIKEVNLGSGSLWSGLLFGMLMFSGAGSAFFITENTRDGKRKVPYGILTAFAISGSLMVLSAYAVQVFLGARMISYSVNPYLIMDYIRSSAGSFIYAAFIVFSLSSSFNLTVGYLNSFRNAVVRMSLDGIINLNMRRFYAAIFIINIAVSWALYLSMGAFYGFVIISGIVSAMFLTVHLITTGSIARRMASSRAVLSITILSASFVLLMVTLMYSLVADIGSDPAIGIIYGLLVVLTLIFVFLIYRNAAKSTVKFGVEES
ncbi:APC family permease [Thermoplasma sp.]|uniref:APC family permease n=1 Tax=Thermoplasma sp. TaxID=1973142 RepID=UPI00260E2689|nr:APC family permease [Thermoplasma sp.]